MMWPYKPATKADGSNETLAVMSSTTLIALVSGTRWALLPARSPVYPAVTSGREISCDAPPRREKVREDLVVPRRRQRDVDRPRLVRLLFGVNVLEVRHVLADDEEVIGPLVYQLERLHLFAGAWMPNVETPRGFAPV